MNNDENYFDIDEAFEDSLMKAKDKPEFVDDSPSVPFMVGDSIVKLEELIHENSHLSACLMGDDRKPVYSTLRLFLLEAEELILEKEPYGILKKGKLVAAAEHVAGRYRDEIKTSSGMLSLLFFITVACNIEIALLRGVQNDE